MNEHVNKFDETITFYTKITGNRIGSWGVEHIKGDFEKDVKPFAQTLKEYFQLFEHGLYKELKDMKAVFNQMETEVAKCSIDKKYFEIEKKELSLDNDHLLEHIICQDIMNTIMHANNPYDNVLHANNNSLDHDNYALDLVKHENDRLMKLLISQDLVHSVVNSLAAINDYNFMQHSFVDEYNETLVLKAELAKKMHYVLNVNSKLVCTTCHECMFDDIHDLYVSHYLNDVNARVKSKSVKSRSAKSKKKEMWKPTGKVYTKVGYIWKPTRQTFTIVGNICPLTRIISTKVVPPRKSISTTPGTVRSRNDQIAKIMGYGDYQLRNVTISWVYYVEGLKYNLFSMGQFNDSDLEVAFWKHTCYVQNLDGDDLLSGSRDTNLYTISLDDMLKSSPIWKSKKSSHKPKDDKTNQEKLYLLHMDLCGPMRVESINRKKYILVIIDDYSRFTWVRFLRSKDEALEFSNPPLSVVSPLPVAAALRPVDPTGSPLSTSIDQDEPSIINSSTQDQEQSLIIFQSVKESLKTPHFHDDPLHETLHEDSTLRIVIKFSIRKQLKTNAMWCYFDAFLTLVEPKNFKEAMLESSWIDVIQEEIHMDVKMAFLNGELREVVYVNQSKGFVDQDKPNHVYKLKKALCGLKQAPRMLYDMFSSFLLSHEFSKGVVDPTLFSRKAVRDILLIQFALENNKEIMALLSMNPVDTYGRKTLSDEDLGENQSFLHIIMSAIALCCNNVQHSRSKYIDVRYHFIKEQVENRVVEIYFVRTEYQLVDIFTKALPQERFNFLIEKLGMQSMSLETLKGLAEEEEE
ncbi:retrovirus-related pol polyprotein from transposon TNT 1-94 [Tanacetum coccineum]